jgi:hypothetical protein
MSQWRVYFTAALVAGIVAVLATGGPAIAHGVRHALFAHNAGKVDGKSAVAASSSVQARKGKLVATSPGSGLLPNNIILQAPDSNLLDGLDSTSFVSGGGTVLRAADEVAPGGSVTLTTSLSTITYSCPANLANPGSVSYANDSAGSEPVWIDDGATVAFTRVGTTPAVAPTAAGGDHLTIGARHQLGTVRTVMVDITSVHEIGNNVCTVTIQALVN